MRTSDPLAKDWNLYRTRHFIIYYDKAPLDFVKNVEDMAEYHFESITRSLGFPRYKSWSFDERAKIYIFNNQDDYVEHGSAMSWSHGAASPRNRVIKTFPTSHGFFDSTLPHELGHIIFREFVGHDVLLPVWFEEGIAIYQEQARRFGSHNVVREAIREERFIPLNELTYNKLYRNKNSSEITLFYAESASIINYLISEHGQQRFKWLCERLRDGKSFEAALVSVYPRFRSLEDLAEAWEDFLK